MQNKMSSVRSNRTKLESDSGFTENDKVNGHIGSRNSGFIGSDSKFKITEVAKPTDDKDSVSTCTCSFIYILGYLCSYILCSACRAYNYCI